MTNFMTNLEVYLNGLQRFGIRPGLERIRALWERVYQPQDEYPIVLVGGTNGKGSTCEFLATMLADSGRRIGLYTSPHLYEWNERIRVLPAAATDQRGPFPGAISGAQIDTLLEAALPHINAVAGNLGQPTEFETLTLLGLWHFQNRRVDAAVVEVGLGGQWDATNVTEPVVSVITHVALDHCDRLGDTREAIARDKIGIARAGRVLVTAETRPEVLDVFVGECAARGARLWPILAPQWSNECAHLEGIVAQSRRVIPAGDSFQHINLLTAAVAKAALEEAMDWPHAPIEPHLYEALLQQGSVPGRAEVLRERPMLLIDGANNPDGAEHLAEHLRSLLVPTQKLILVLGILADKDYAAMTALLAPLAHTVIATQSNSPRAVDAEAIAVAARPHCHRVEVVLSVPAAVQRALQLAGVDDLICVTGSFYTIAEVERAGKK
jgi:dihydrofolate synthase/folylpolyglutamate synthase